MDTEKRDRVRSLAMWSGTYQWVGAEIWRSTFDCVILLQAFGTVLIYATIAVAAARGLFETDMLLTGLKVYLFILALAVAVSLVFFATYFIAAMNGIRHYHVSIFGEMSWTKKILLLNIFGLPILLVWVILKKVFVIR